MAGDWIKIRSNIKDDPDVVVIAGRLSTDEFSIVGRLHAVWAWLDQHSKDGTNVRITSAYLDRLVACPGFADALRAVGWLDGRDGSLTFPNFDRHNGESAKRRAVEAKRKASQREQGEVNGTNVPHVVPQKLGPEKRREEKRTKKSPSETLGQCEAQLFAEFWAAYPRKKSKGDAEKAWVKMGCRNKAVTILDAIKRAKASREWQKDGGQFIPYPASWLNSKGWEDDYTPVVLTSKPEPGKW